MTTDEIQLTSTTQYTVVRFFETLTNASTKFDVNTLSKNNIDPINIIREVHIAYNSKLGPFNMTNSYSNILNNRDIKSNIIGR